MHLQLLLLLIIVLTYLLLLYFNKYYSYVRGLKYVVLVGYHYDWIIRQIMNNPRKAILKYIFSLNKLDYKEVPISHAAHVQYQ